MSLQKVRDLYFSPISRLVERAGSVHKKHFYPGKIQAARLLSIKTGGCSEDCAYCPQSARYQTGVRPEKLMSVKAVVEKAKEAKKEGAGRFCMGAGWREVTSGPAFDQVLEMVREVSALGLEVCCTLGMLDLKQARLLKQAGLYAYNHNIDTSRDYYPRIITTRKFEDRLKTIENVRRANLTVCTGGILGLGESHEDRVSFIHELVRLSPQPESVTINTLVPMKGTPLEKQKPPPLSDVVRVIAVCRILMERSFIRLSAGRKNLSEGEQLLCFFSGANSLFFGDKLLTTKNPSLRSDQKMLKNLGFSLLAPFEKGLRPNDQNSPNGPNNQNSLNRSNNQNSPNNPNKPNNQNSLNKPPS